MPTTNERIRHVTAKLDRAKKHLADLEQLHENFRSSDHCRIESKVDLDRQRRVYFVSAIMPISDEFALVFGDILHNLRGALDHLAYQLACVGRHNDGPHEDVYFPIADSAEKYEQRKKAGALKGMRPEAIQVIDALKPYKGGDDSLWLLSRLNNVDKHRLVITVGSAFRSVDMAPVINEVLRSIPTETEASWPTNPSFFLKPANRKFPLKVGDVLLNRPTDEVPLPVQFAIDVAIGEPGLAEGESLVEVARNLTQAVATIVPSFVPYLE